jgi:hypothetical protein
MRSIAFLLLGLLALVPAAPQAQLPATGSALDADPRGWVDLLADKSLKAWTRVPLGAGKTLAAGDVNAPSPWKLDPTGTILICEGDKAGHEMYRPGQEYGDHVLHVEWRFAKLEGEPGYNSGIYVRASADGSIWHQAQTGPSGGFLFGNTLVNGTPQRVNLRDAMKENRVRPAGEWNTYEITAKGPTVSLWVNGAVTSTLEKLEVPRGYVGFEAEGYRIEFRNVKIKTLD